MYKIVFASFLMILFFAAFSNAQNRMSSADRAKQLQKELGLTDAQTVKVDSIFTAAFDKMHNVDGDRMQRRSVFMQIMEETNKQISLILNDEQKVKYDKLLRDRMMNRRPGMQGRMK